MSKKEAPDEILHNFQFYIKDIRFHYGGVSFRHFVPSLNKRFEFTIINYNIREEFDAIKDLFINTFNSKKVDVTSVISKVDEGNYIIDAHSPQIESIDDKIMKSVKLECARQIATERIVPHANISALTMDQFFEALNEQHSGYSFLYEKEHEFLDDIVTVSNSRHYFNLRYLSGKHLHQLMRLRFILEPFSFLFLIEGRSQYFLVWETLDTEEATYVWPIQKDKESIKKALENMPRLLSLIKFQGKQAYRNSNKGNFIRILHQYKNAMKGFTLWKDELEAHLYS